jgi:MFS family permease
MRSLYWITCAVSLGGLLFGFDSGVISGCEEAIQAEFALSPFWHGLVVAGALMGTVFGALAAGRMCDRLGRKPTLVWMGVLFLVSGLISCVTYFWAKRNVSEYKIYDAEGNLVAGEQPTFPIVGIGSAILGLILALTPTAFVSALMYIIGAILILGAINQYMNLIGARRYGSVSFWFWVMPTLILLTGVYVMVKPLAPLATAMLVLGWCTLVYGVVELINAMKFYNDKKAWLKSQEQQPQLDNFEEISEK